MQEGLIVIAFLLIAAGFFGAGRSWEEKNVRYWHEKWLINEYKLARLEGREPEDD